MMKEPLENITIIPDETNTQKWTVHIGGPVSLTPSMRIMKRKAGLVKLKNG
jgi:hypothetical protein